MQDRYAIYFVPSADEEYYQRISQWLGYSIHTGRPVSQTELSPTLQPFTGFTRHARMYGCHATLKPPFRLKPNLKEKQLVKIFKHFSRLFPPIQCSGLQIENIGRFVALTLTDECPRLHELATDCVQTFDLFRDDLTPAEFNKRQPERLSPNQLLMLKQWGYPFVIDEFRFHITLSDPLPESSLAACKKALIDDLSPIPSRPFILDSISLCYQPAPSKPFITLETHPLQG